MRAINVSLTEGESLKPEPLPTPPQTSHKTHKGHTPFSDFSLEIYRATSTQQRSNNALRRSKEEFGHGLLGFPLQAGKARPDPGNIIKFGIKSKHASGHCSQDFHSFLM